MREERSRSLRMAGPLPVSQGEAKHYGKLISVVGLFQAPEGTGRAGGSLDELFAVLDLRVENRRERGFLGPLGGRGLHLDRLLGDFLAGVDVPGGELLRALDAQQVAAKSFEHGTILFVR